MTTTDYVLARTAGEYERWFEAFAEESARADAHAALWPLMIGTWKRKPR